MKVFTLPPHSVHKNRMIGNFRFTDDKLIVDDRTAKQLKKNLTTYYGCTLEDYVDAPVKSVEQPTATLKVEPEAAPDAPKQTANLSKPSTQSK